MARAGLAIACAPLIYGYVSYAGAGFRPHRLHFADIPAFGAQGPIGSALGGTGLAVSAFCAHATAAADFAYWVAERRGAGRPLRSFRRPARPCGGLGTDAVNASRGRLLPRHPRNARTAPG